MNNRAEIFQAWKDGKISLLESVNLVIALEGETQPVAKRPDAINDSHIGCMGCAK